MNMHEAGETNLLPMKSHVTIKYPSISMTSYRDFLGLSIKTKKDIDLVIFSYSIERYLKV